MLVLKVIRLVLTLSVFFKFLCFVTVVKADQVLIESDIETLREGLRAAESFKVTSTLSWERKTKDLLAQKILTWARLNMPNPNINFLEISEFIITNPNWPNQIGLQQLAEEAINENTPDELVKAFFKKRKPITGYGKASLGQVFINQGSLEKGQKLIRDAWINNDFFKHYEKKFYKRYRKILNIKDHYSRLDRLQWQGSYWSARRMLWRIPKDYRALGIARMFLRYDMGNVDKAIAKVPSSLKNDLGLKYERLRWRRKKGKYDSAQDILNGPFEKIAKPKRWWKERSIIIRHLLKKGDFKNAYHIASNHKINIKSGNIASYAEAEWLAGWIALRFLNNAKDAEVHFKNMYKEVKFPISRSRGAYWIARAIEASNSKKKYHGSAEIWYRIAALYPTTYYGQLSLIQLNLDGSLMLAPQLKLHTSDIRAFEEHELTRVIKLLKQVAADRWLKPFLIALDKVSKKPTWRQLTIKLAEKVERYDVSLKIAKIEGRENWKFTKSAFPQIVPKPNLIISIGSDLPEWPLILSVIRQESAFYFNARSPANAQGLMQLMPNTASRIAKIHGIPYSFDRLTNDVQYNIAIGRAYLAELLKEFKGSYILALSAYNAGPSRVRKWIRESGDPREFEVDVIDWVERIPFKETRNYVQRVLENLQVYRQILSKK